MAWVYRGLRNSVVTTKWPRRTDPYFDEFPASPQLVADPDPHALADAKRLIGQGLCPTGAMTVDENGDILIDQGKCVDCSRCVAAAPGVFTWRTGADTARLRRRALVVDADPDTGTDPAELKRLRAALARRTRRLRRSAHIRHIDVGTDGSDEWEVQALTNPVYDIHRLGIFISPSPRHADILLVTGIGASGMRAPLARTRAAMPDPVVVIAAGTDAVSGGLIGSAYDPANGVDIGRGIGGLLDVDVWIPGSPASPFALLHGILLALGRVPVPGGAS